VLLSDIDARLPAKVFEVRSSPTAPPKIKTDYN
jgi:hypothetical protein